MRNIMTYVWLKTNNWYSGLDRSDKDSIDAVSFVIGFSLAMALLFPSTSSANEECEVATEPDFNEEQVASLQVCAEQAFKDSASVYASMGPMPTYSFLSYKVGLCMYKERNPDGTEREYNDWLRCVDGTPSPGWFF